MKKLLFTLLTIALLAPTTYQASAKNLSSTAELAVKKQKKKKSLSKRKSKKTYSQSKGCTYEGHTLHVGKKGGCYYMAGNSKEYVDRSYCSGCN